METEAKANGSYTLPSQYSEAMTLARHGTWDFFTLRATPHWIMQRVYFIWHLDALAEKKNNDDLEREMHHANRA